MLCLTNGIVNFAFGEVLSISSYYFCPMLKPKLLLLIILLLALKPGISSAQEVISSKTLLSEMVNNAAVAEYPVPYYSEHQASSYDRQSVDPGKPGWFANHDFSQYIRTEVNGNHKEQVMLDADGPGAIVRFWITSTDKRDGVLRIYFDNQTHPAIKIDGYDLMKSGLPLVIPHSSYEPKGKGGSTLYFPLPYAKHCKITWQEDDPQDNPPRYYQINYRSYAKRTKVKTFDSSQLPSLKNVIAQTKNALWHPKVAAEGKDITLDKAIPAGKTITIKLPKGPSAIALMKIKISTGKEDDYEQALRSTILKISFDGQQTVWCPLGDFAGSGVGGKPLQSWYRTITNDGEIISRWLMPYKKNATVSLINLNEQSIKASLILGVKKYKWTNKRLYFHASWKQIRNEAVTKWDSSGASDLNFITIKGRGIYLGNSMSVYNHMHTWYGEGDQKIWVDRGSFPAEFGTGTEDYYNTSWAPVVIYQTPFANAPRADNNDSYGYNTFTRTRNLDAIPFQSFFKMDLGMLGWQSGTADFAITSYWYGAKGSEDNCKPSEKEASIKLPQ